eukprot:TRINITY_DN29383_c0_g1_i1.p1 TRINITY_DN29383_c0_g1~~TRINITY_DN29383_c0_g1_i1.p1  ORF type:complete len:228 (+),score=28.04 TRINITY_DN29383_c0_g1_i1:46-729(+)
MVASFEVVTDGTDVRRGSGGSDVSHGSFRRLTVATDSFTSNPSQAGDDATASHGTESGLSQTEATENFVVYLVGAGILILPKTMADVGIVAACILMMTAFATTFVCSLMVVACCDRLESMSGSSRGSVVESYEALANSILGAAGTAGVTIAKNCYLLGLLAVFILMVVEGLHQWTGLEIASIRWYIVAPIFVLVAMIRLGERSCPCQTRMREFEIVGVHGFYVYLET